LYYYKDYRFKGPITSLNNVLLEGILPINKKGMVEAWIEIHKEDLLADWELAIEGNTLFNIEPLK
jgi:hypothetical protein